MPQLVKRSVPVNLRQSGNADIQLLLSTRVRKSPFWHKSVEAGCRVASVYNKMYHPRAYFPPEEGGLMGEYEYLTKHVTMWNVSVERQIQIKGPDALKFTNLLVTRDLEKICPVNQARYVILCNEKGGIVNDPVLLRVAEDEFWLSISDSDVLHWAQGVNYGLNYDVEINEIDVAPVQIQGPKSRPLMQKICGKQVDELKYYKLWQTTINGLDVIVSRTGFSAEVGYEIYLKDATKNADKLWNYMLKEGEEFQIRVIAPSHIRRIEAGILSYNQDMDIETNPFEANLDKHVKLTEGNDFIGREALEKIKKEGVKRRLVGLRIDGARAIHWYNPDYWPVLDKDGKKDLGYVTSAFYSPKLGCNIALAMMPVQHTAVGTHLKVDFQEEGNPADATICEVPFFDPGKKIPAAS